MAEKAKRPVGEDMGPKSTAKDKYSREISIIWNAVNGQRPKACVSVQVLDEIPNKFLPSSVAEFLYGLREDRKKEEKLKVKSTDVVEITATGVELQGSRDKRSPVKEARFSQNSDKQKEKLKKAKRV